MTHVGKLLGAVSLAAASLWFAAPASAVETRDGAACATRDVPAAIDGMIPVDLPTLARMQGLAGTATVQIKLDKTGAVLGATIVDSTNKKLDGTAIQSALIQRYTPEIRNCEAVDGTYLLDVELGR